MSKRDPETNPRQPLPSARFEAVETPASDAGAFRIAGRLDTDSSAVIWDKARDAIRRLGGRSAVLDASELEYCDGSGLALLLELRRLAQGGGGRLDIRDLSEAFAQRLERFDPEEFEAERRATGDRSASAIEEMGRTTVGMGRDLHEMVAFVGELLVAFARIARHPGQVRWRDAFLIAETAGVNALPIVMLIGFIIGLIMAFQAAIPMRQFGVELYVADLIALSMLRELGPLMTAIILAGRTGSAFAAEIGTMRINEEIDALTTMGIDPVRFLVLTRVIATTVVTPLLAVFANLMGLIGGSIVLLSLGYPFVAYYNEAVAAVGVVDLAGGLAKAVVFGFLVAGIGCLRGLQTRMGATAVGSSTTSAVVTSIVLIALADSVFAVTFYYLGI